MYKIFLSKSHHFRINLTENILKFIIFDLFESSTVELTIRSIDLRLSMCFDILLFHISCIKPN